LNGAIANKWRTRRVPTLVILGTFETNTKPAVNSLASASISTLRRHPRRWMVHVDEAAMDAG
jgi:hypothetical protein